MTTPHTQLYLYVTRYGAGDEKLLVGVDGDALDGLLVRAEKMDLPALTEVPHGNLQEGEEDSVKLRARPPLSSLRPGRSTIDQVRSGRTD